MKFQATYNMEQLTTNEATTLLFKNPKEDPNDDINFSLYWYRRDIENCINSTEKSFWSGTLSILCCIDLMATIYGNKPLSEYANGGEERNKYIDFTREILQISDYPSQNNLYMFRNAMVHNGGLINVTIGNTKTFFSISPDETSSQLFTTGNNPNEYIVNIFALYKVFINGVGVLETWIKSLTPESYPKTVFELNATRWTENSIISASYVQFIEKNPE